MRSVRRRPKLAKTVDAVLHYVEAEVARLIAADPEVEAARQRAVRRSGRSTSRAAAGRPLTPAL